MTNETGSKNSKGLFMVDLRGLELTDDQLKRIDAGIKSSVDQVLSEVSDLEGQPLAALGPGIMGLVLKA